MASVAISPYWTKERSSIATAHPICVDHESSTSTVDPYYGFHGTIGRFSTGVEYTFETSLGGELKFWIRCWV